jgi:hypothetical protein
MSAVSGPVENHSVPSVLAAIAGHTRAAIAVIVIGGYQGWHLLACHQPLFSGDFVDNVEGFSDIVGCVDDDGGNWHVPAQ